MSMHSRIGWSHNLSSTSDNPMKDPNDPLDQHFDMIENAKRATFSESQFQRETMSKVPDKDVQQHYLRFKDMLGTKCYGLSPTGIRTSMFVKALASLGLAEPRFLNESFIATGSGAHEFFQKHYGEEEWFDGSSECLQKCLYDTTTDLQVVDDSIRPSYVEMCACEMQKGTVTHRNGNSQRKIRPDVFLCTRVDNDTVRSPLFFRFTTGKVTAFHPSRKTNIIQVLHGGEWRRIDELMTTPWFSDGFSMHHVRRQPWKLKMTLHPKASKWIADSSLDKDGSELWSDIHVEFSSGKASNKRKR